MQPEEKLADISDGKSLGGPKFKEDLCNLKSVDVGQVQLG